MSKDYQKLNSAFHKTTKDICKEISDKIQMVFETNAIDLICELTLKQLMVYATDLESFEKHAKRSTITNDDVKLLARRNESLKELLDQKLQQIQSAKVGVETANSGNKRKRKASSSTT